MHYIGVEMGMEPAVLLIRGWATTGDGVLQTAMNQQM